MKTLDLFKNTRSARRINESIEKTFGKRLNLESFDLQQLEDARNKLRTQIHTVRGQSGFNETVENEAMTQAQWMLDAINAEIAEREEFVADAGPAEVEEGYSTEVQNFFQEVANGDDGFDLLYSAQSGEYGKDIQKAVQDMYDNVASDYGYHSDDNFEEIFDRMMDQIELDYGDGDNDPDEGGETDDNYAMASAGFGSDEDYESINNEDDVDDFVAAGGKIQYGKKQKGPRRPGLSMASRHIGGGGDKMKASRTGKAANTQGKPVVGSGSSKRFEDAPPGAKAERMVKHIKKGYADDGKLTKKEKGIAYATAWKQHNKEKNESIESGEDMTKLQEGEIQQASAIVTAKTMVDRVGRWIEELSGMENDTLLQLGDSIRDEMGSEQAKNFISAVAPAIQAALENLKTTRETLSTGVRTLTGEEQPAEMLGDEPEGEMPSDELGAASPDEMNAEPTGDIGDEFAAAEPAAGGLGDAGREQRESIDYQNRLLKVLAG